MQRERRASRPLFAALAVVIVLGLGFYALKFSRARAAEAHRRAEAQASAQEATPAAAFTAPQTQPAAPAPAPLLAAVTNTPSGVLPAPPADPPVAPLVTSTPSLRANAIAQAEPTTRPALLATDLTIRPDASVAAPVITPTTAPVASGNSVSDAKQKKETGDLVGARDELNASLTSIRHSSSRRSARLTIPGPPATASRAANDSQRLQERTASPGNSSRASITSTPGGSALEPPSRSSRVHSSPW
jgi:cytoskeletal protein RodZ